MAKVERWFAQDLKKSVPVRYLDGSFFNEDAAGNRIGVEVYSDGEAVTLAGSITGYCVRPDGTTVPISGARSSNRAYIDIPQSALAVPGPLTVTIKNTESSVITTLCAVVGIVTQSRTGVQVNPGQTITDWTNQISAQLQAVQTAADNLGSTLAVPYDSLTFPVTAGTYTVYSGNVYRANQDISTSEEWTADHWTQVKVCNEIYDLKNEAAELAEHFPATGKLVAGISTTASANGAVATGVSTTASGRASHAEGQLTTADGQVAHAEGYGTTASGDYSHAEGFGTKASGDHQHAFGKYNVEDTNDTYLEIAGNGTADNARSNARTLDWNGNETLAGDLTVNKGGAGEMVLGQEVSSLKSAIDYLGETGNIAVSHNLTWQNGYVGATGVINSSTLSGFAIVPLEAGETVRIGTKNTNIAIISTTTESSLSVGDTVTPVQITTNVDTYQTYEYTAESPVNVVLCVRLSNYEVSFFKGTNLVTKSEISNITGLEKSIVYDGQLFSGTVDAATGVFVTTGAWSCTDYFQIPFVIGSKMTFTGTIYPGSDYGVAFYDYNKKFLMGIGASNASDWGITPSTTSIQTLTIVIPSNAAYIRTSVLSSSVSPTAFRFAGVTLGDIVNRVTNLEYATQFSHIKTMKLLVLGDSYSAQRRWINALMGYFGIGSSYITLAVTGATVKDQSNDRTTYPYTSRPTSDGGTNQNTISCQIAKLERLMAGVDLDEGETQIYTSEDDYPNVIIIEGGQNDFSDNDSTEETYFDQFEVATDNVYIKQTESGEASVGVASVRPNIETINRTCFAGAYRYAIEKLMRIFPNAQIYITTASDISYRKNFAVTKVRYKIAEQQIKCARMASVSVIDWYANGQMSVLNNTLTGSGTQADPYIVGGATDDTLDSLHPNDRGASKLGQVAAKAIYSNWMDIE